MWGVTPTDCNWCPPALGPPDGCAGPLVRPGGGARRRRRGNRGNFVMTPPPGWFPNPSGESGQRYWNGREWTDVNPPVKGPARSGSHKKALAIVLGAVFVLGGGCAACIAVLGNKPAWSTKFQRDDVHGADPNSPADRAQRGRHAYSFRLEGGHARFDIPLDVVVE